MKFFVALRIAAYAAEFAKAAGIDLNELIAKGDPAGAAKAQLEKMKPSADAAAAVAKITGLETEIAALTTALDSAKKEIEEAQASAKTAVEQRDLIASNTTTFTGALAAAGIKIELKSGEKIDAAAITTAATAAIALKGRELLAKHGIHEPIATAPDGDPTKSAAQKVDPKLTGLDRTIAAFKAAKPGKN